MEFKLFRGAWYTYSKGFQLLCFRKDEIGESWKALLGFSTRRLLSSQCTVEVTYTVHLIFGSFSWWRVEWL